MILLLIWIIAFFSCVFVLGFGDSSPALLTLLAFAVIVSLSLSALIYLSIFPQKFYIDTLLYCVWGFMGLIEGEALISLVFCLLGCVFTFKAGFVHTCRKVQLTAIALIVMMAIASQCGYVVELSVENLLYCLAFLMIRGFIGFLLLPELRKLLVRQESAVYRLSPSLFTHEDTVLLEKILGGEKYDSITSFCGTSDSALKKHLERMFWNVGVDGRISFIFRYAGCVFVLEEHVQPPVSEQSAR